MSKKATPTDPFELPARAENEAVRGIAQARKSAVPPPSLVDALRASGLESFLGEPLDLPALEIGERIRTARHLRGFTQAELAQKAGCQQSDLSDIERGRGSKGPSYATLKRIAEALDVSLPVNPQAATMIAGPVTDHVSVWVVGTGGRAELTKSFGTISNYVPLFSDTEWSTLRDNVLEHLGVGGSGAGDVCYLIRIAPGAKAYIRSDRAEMVVAEVSGGGTYHASRPLWRWQRRRNAKHRNPAVALLDSESELEVDVDPAQSLTLMMMPPAVLRRHD